MLTLGTVEEGSVRTLGLEGRRPRRPLRLSVRTTKEEERSYKAPLTCSIRSSPIPRA